MPASANAAVLKFRPIPVMAGFVLFMMLEPLNNITGALLGPGAVQTVLRALWLPVYGIIFVLAYAARGALAKVAVSTPILAGLTLLALASVICSVNPELTLRRCIALVMTLLFGWCLAALFSWRNFFKLAARVGAVAVGFTYAITLAFPHIGIEGAESVHPGSWSGLWEQKNTLGGVMMIFAGVFLAAMTAEPRRNHIWLGFAVLVLGLIMLSGSATALLGLILITGVSAFGVILRRGGGAGGAAIVGILAAGLAVVTIATLAPDLVFKALGRDATFTGRVDIPDQVLAIINRRPWLGYGNGAFWEQDVFGGGMVREALQWEVFSAHQGWLELALDLGWVGVAAFAVSLALVSLRALAAFAQPGVALWAPALLAVFVMYSFSESYIFPEHGFLWAFFVMTAAKLSLAGHAQRQPSSISAKGIALTA